MNDYKRFVSYIYNYEMKIKKNNVGYARVELKDNQCKITIHMQVKSIINGKLNIYGFLRNKENLIGIPLGEFNLKNGNGESQIFVQANQVGKAGHDFSEIGGIIIYVAQDKYFGTEWDDKPLVFQEFQVEELKEEKEAIVKTAELRCEERIEERTAGRTQERVEERMEERMEERTRGRKEERNEKIMQNTTSEYIMNPIIKSTECNPCFQAYSLDEMYDRFAYTVTDDFMLHGYHRFGHLGVLEKNNRLILGVPGVFCRREEQIANNSGFHNFISKSNKPLKYGDFGYWYSSTEYLK